MSRINEYRKGKITYNISLILLAFLVILVCYKIGHIIRKVVLVNEAKSLYAQEEWIEAEATLQKAEGYKWFIYEEDTTAHYLANLSWITEYKDRLEQWTNDIKKSYTEGQYTEFIQQVKEYENSNFETLDSIKKTYLLEHYPVTSEIDKGWKTFKASMEQALKEPLGQGDYVWAKEAIWDVPTDYFEDSKEVYIQKLFTACDAKLFKAEIIKPEHYTAFEALLREMNALYTMNEKYGYKSEWLTEKLKSYIEELLTKKSKEDNIQVFSQYANVYTQNAKAVYQSNEIDNIIKNFIKRQENKAQALVDKAQYADAIKLYKEMHVFKDYTKEIKEVEAIQKYNESTLLLSKEASAYTYLKEGAYGAGDSKYVMGVQKESNILEVVLIEGTKTDYEIGTYEMSLGSREIKDILVYSNFIILLKPSSQRAYTYEVIQLKQNKLKTVFEIEANSIELIGQSMDFRVNSPIEGYEGYDYIYESTLFGYRKAEIEAARVSLNDPDLGTYEGKVISFEGYIPQNQTGDVVLAMYIEENVYQPDKAVQVYREDGEPITSGSYKIIGEYVGNVTYYDETLTTESTRPHIKILETK